MIEYLNQIDQNVTIYLNSFHSPFWDSVMTTVTNKYLWFPFYLALIIYMVLKFKKKGIVMTFSFLIMVLFIEIMSSWISKPYFKRYRPCKDPVISEQIRSIGCRSQYGFFSGHSSQSFGIAMLTILLLSHKSRWFLIAILWATVVAYSRIYLGVHYLGDVLFGAFFGMASAALFHYLYKKFIQKYSL